MPENMMNSAHKATTPEYRENYERIFGGNDDNEESKEVMPCESIGGRTVPTRTNPDW
jgi:hypothetical protein